MNVLLLGSGGREHALAWKIAQSPLLSHLFIAPGNPGTAAHGDNIPLSPLDFEAVAHFVRDRNIGLVVVGPEEPLVKGLRDHLETTLGPGAPVICGPGAAGARLEGSKAFSKAFMERHGIPTAAYGEFHASDWTAIRTFLDQSQPPYVIKADGLAAGKGVIITSDREEAEATIAEMFSGSFGDAGQTVVLEAFLDGLEFSVFALCDGEHYQLLPAAKDYKRVGEGDQGPNTGGMGAVSPVPFLDEALLEKVRLRIVEPTIRGLRAEDIDYQGFIFFGLIRVGQEPMVIEYNCRMGDPETEVVMPRLETDLLALLQAMGRRELQHTPVAEKTDTALTVMMVSEGYPGDYPQGRTISGVPSGALVFHAGTKLSEEGTLQTKGGRVLACTALGPDIAACRSLAYPLVEGIHFEGAHYRRDIGLDLL